MDLPVVIIAAVAHQVVVVAVAQIQILAQVVAIRQQQQVQAVMTVQARLQTGVFIKKIDKNLKKSQKKTNPNHSLFLSHAL